MNFFTQEITRIITTKILNKTVEEGKEVTNNGRVEQNPTLKPLFYGALVLGIVSFVLAAYADQLIAGVALFVLFGSLSIPVLISYKTCWINYDTQGFVRSNFLGIKKQYSWDDVTGIGQHGSQVIIEVNNSKKIHLNETWLNRQCLVREIEKRCKNIKSIQVSVSSYNVQDIKASYKHGVLKNAVIVASKDLSEHKKYKIFHQIICGMMIFVGCGMFIGMLPPSISFIALLTTHILVIISTVLYYKKPEHFTMREKARYDQVGEVKNHKLATAPYMYVGGAALNTCFALLVRDDLAYHTPYLEQVIFLVVCLMVIFVLNLLFFKRKSWEYQNYKVGLVSFIFFFVFYILSFFIFYLI